MSFENISFIDLKDDDWLERQRIAGRCVAGVLKTLSKIVKDKTPNVTLKDLEAEAVRQIEAADCSPTFKGYKGFPGSICLSVNKNLVHGIPTDYLLQEGDVVKIDLGATYKSAIADAAVTVIYGGAKDRTHLELIDVCKKSLERGINTIRVGKQLGCIGYAVHKYVSNNSRFGLVTKYGGHGISSDKPHAQPFVSNKAKQNEGPRIQAGLTIAIEPMVTIGEPTTIIEKDGWTVSTPGINVHFEHTVFVHPNSVEIITEYEI